MPALESHTGLLAQTIPNYKRRSFVNISNTKQYYTAFPAIVKNAKTAMENQWDKFNFGLPIEVKDGGGTSYKFNVQVGKGNTFSWVDMNDPVNLDMRDHQVQADIPKRQCRIHWSYNEFELAACRGKEEITNLLTTRRLGKDQDFADSFENWFWSAPPASTDAQTGFPLRYWLYSEPESTAGTTYSTYTGLLESVANQNFLNVNHASYTSGPGGISRATYPMWGNANVQYTSFSDADCVEKLTVLMLMSDFYAPTDFPDAVKSTPQRAMYTTLANVVIKARLARQQNDANGSDLVARFQDADLFRVPMYRVPQLDTPDFVLYGSAGASANKDVIYGINWSTFYWCGTRGFMLDERLLGPSLEAPMAHTHLQYLQGNLICLDPRQNWVASK